MAYEAEGKEAGPVPGLLMHLSASWSQEHQAHTLFSLQHTTQLFFRAFLSFVDMCFP